MKVIFKVLMMTIVLTGAALALAQNSAGIRSDNREVNLGYYGIIHYGTIGTCTQKNGSFKGKQIRVPLEKLIGTGHTEYQAYKDLNSACQQQIQDNCEGGTLRLETKCRTLAKNGIYEI